MLRRCRENMSVSGCEGGNDARVIGYSVWCFYVCVGGCALRWPYESVVEGG